MKVIRSYYSTTTSRRAPLCARPAMDRRGDRRPRRSGGGMAPPAPAGAPEPSGTGKLDLQTLEHLAVAGSAVSGDSTAPDLAGPPRRLPHRYPFLMVDRVLELGDNRVLTLKNVSIDEPFFNGHFPGRPVMPGVLVVEAMAQSGALLALGMMSGNEVNETAPEAGYWPRCSC